MPSLLTSPSARRVKAATPVAAETLAASAPATTGLVARLSSLSLATGAAAAFSLSAGLVHLGYTYDHWWIWPIYGMFFLGSGLLQTGLAVALVMGRVGKWIASAAIVGNLGTICLYVVSRTPYGAPVGPMRGHAELPGLADMGVTVGEFITVVCLLTFLPRRAGRAATWLLLLLGVGLWALRLTDQFVY